MVMYVTFTSRDSESWYCFHRVYLCQQTQTWCQRHGPSYRQLPVLTGVFMFVCLCVPQNLGSMGETWQMCSWTTKMQVKLEDRYGRLPIFAEYSGRRGWYVNVRRWRLVSLLLYLPLTKVMFYRATHMHSADYAVERCPSSVCLNDDTYPQSFFTIGQPHHFSFSAPNGMAIFRRGSS